MKSGLLSLAVFALATPVTAQTIKDEPLVITPQEEPDDILYLPANTEVVVALNQTLTTKGKAFREGDTFSLTVQHHVFLNDIVVIPKGARAVGRITWMTSKGAFGKSGKMEIDIEYVEVNGRMIPLEGHFRQEGEGNTVATVGGVVAAGVFAGFITGKSATIPRGRELIAYTRDAVPVRIVKRPVQPQSGEADGQMAVATTDTRSLSSPASRQTKKWGLTPVEAN